MDWAFGKFGMGTFSAGAVWVGYAVSQQIHWLVAYLIGMELVITLTRCRSNKENKYFQNILSIQVFTVIEKKCRERVPNVDPRQCLPSVATHTK